VPGEERQRIEIRAGATDLREIGLAATAQQGCGQQNPEFYQSSPCSRSMVGWM
jgi:hypothetical protein